MDMYMARGKPRLKLSPTTMVDSMAMDLDTMEDMATGYYGGYGHGYVYGKREAEAEAKPYYYGGLYGHGLGYYGGYVYGKREAEAEAKPYYYGGYSTAMDLDTMKNMSMARGKPKLRPSL